MLPPAFVTHALTPAEQAEIAREQRALGRITTGAHGQVRLLSPAVEPEVWCLLDGGLRGEKLGVGDWVVVDPAASPPLVVRRIPPRTVLRRRSPRGGPQIVACNIELVLICTALGAELSLRRVERWAVLAAEAGIDAVVALTKVDAGRSAAREVSDIHETTGLDVLPLSARDGVGLDALRARMPAGSSTALVGSSGVGKSTLTNALLGEEAQETAAVRERDDRGRHTTTARSLLALPWGAWLIDNPGTREVGLLVERGMGEAFPDVEAVLTSCRYRGCSHTGEEGCAVDAGVADGTLRPERVRAWRRLQEEIQEEAEKAAQREAARNRRLARKSRSGGRGKRRR